jgi:hypothetical protein
MLRDLDIKLVALVLIGAIVFGVYATIDYFRFRNTPEEEVFYISPDIGDVEPADLSGGAPPEEPPSEAAPVPAE